MMDDLRSFTTYRIGEAAALLGVKTSVLRFWETEFPQINPIRKESGQRLYSEDSMDVLRRIRRLLYEEKLTIEGARMRLETGQTETPETSAVPQATDPETSVASPVPPAPAPALAPGAAPAVETSPLAAPANDHLVRTLNDLRAELLSIRTLLT